MGVPAGMHVTVHLAAVPAAAAEAVVRRVIEAQQVQRVPFLPSLLQPVLGTSAAGACQAFACLCAVPKICAHGTQQRAERCLQG